MSGGNWWRAYEMGVVPNSNVTVAAAIVILTMLAWIIWAVVSGDYFERDAK
jgi:hypothetical protein